MAKILDSQYSNLVDGQKLEAAQLEQDRGVIRIAVNDNQSQLYRIWFGEEHNYVFDTKADLLAFASPVNLDFAVVMDDESLSPVSTSLYQYQTSAWVIISENYSLMGIVTGDILNAFMTKTVYDTNDSGRVDKSESLDDGINVVTAARAKVMSDWLNQDVKSTSSPTFVNVTAGKIIWGTNVESSYNGTDIIDEYGDGITRERGKNLFTGIKARTIIANGTVIQYDGAVGASGVIWAKIADEAEINVNPLLLLGVTTTSFTANEVKDINIFGAINDIDTTNYDGNSGTSADEGQIIYFDSINGLGGITLDKPEAPNVQIPLGIISIYHASAGQIKIKPELGLFLGDLHDIYLNGGVSDGDIIKYNTSTLRWEAFALDTALGAIDTKIDELELSDLADVDALSPQLGEVIQWNGVSWVNGDIVTQGAGKSITWFIEDTPTIPPITDYELLSPIPLGLVEEDDSVALTVAVTDTLISSYATEVLGRTKIEAGSWNFETFARVSSANGATFIKFKVYKRATGGTETLLFESITEEISTLTNQLFSIISVQTEFVILATDRIVIKYYGYTTSAANPTITMVHSGTENASHVDTPLQTLHNDLAGLQGGNSTERYHMLLAELNYLIALATSLGASTVGYDDTVGFTGKTDVQAAIDQAYADIQSIIAGSVADGSITDAKLSDLAGQIKERVAILEEEFETPTIDKSVPYSGPQGLYALSKDALAVAIHGINVLPVKNYYGRDLNWLLENYNFLVDDTGWSVFAGSQAVADGILKITGGTTIAGTRNTYDTSPVDGSKVILKGRIRTTLANVTNIRLRFADGITTVDDLITSPVQNQWYEVSLLATYSVGSTQGQIDFRATDDIACDIEIDGNYGVFAIKVPDDITTIAEMEALLDGKAQAKGNSWVGKPVELDQLQDNRDKFGNYTSTEFILDEETSQDLIPYQKFVADGSAIDGIVDLIWEANTTYTVLASIIKNTVNDTFNFVFGTNIDGSSVSIFGTSGIGVFKLLFTTGATPLTTNRQVLSSLNTSGEIIVKQAIIKGDYTHLTDEEALRIIKEQEFGTFEVKGTWITSIEKQKFNKATVTNDSFVQGGDGNLGSNTSFVASDFIEVIANKTVITIISGLATAVNAGSFYDSNFEYTGSGISAAQLLAGIVVPSDAKYIRVTVSKTVIDDFQLEINTVASAHEDFTESIVHIDGELHDNDTIDVQGDDTHVFTEDDVTAITNLSTVQSITISKPINSIGYGNLDTGWARIEGWTEFISGSGDSADNIGKFRTFGAVNDYIFYVALGTFATLNDAKTFFSGVLSTYELATYLPRTEANNNEIDVDGKLLTSVDATYSQVSSGGVIDYFTVTQPLNLYGQLLLNILTDLSQQKEIVKNKQEIDKLIIGQDNLDTNKVDKVDGKGLSTNDYSTAEKTKLGTIEEGATTDQSNAEIKASYEANTDTNEYSDAEKAKVAFVTVTEAVDLDKVVERVLLNSTKLDVPSTTTEPAGINITVSESIDNFDALEFHTKYTTISTKIETIILDTNDNQTSLSGNAGFSNVSIVDYHYKIKRISTTTLTAWYASSITTTFSTDVTAYAPIAGIDLVKIYGIKY